MSRKISTETEINAPPQRVWDILTDFSSYSDWNPFIRDLSGKPEKGERLTAYINPPGKKGMTFRPVVLVSEKDREFRWLGHFLIPGLFDGEHSFTIEPIDNDRVRFHHEEIFSGILAPFLWKTLDENTRQGFEDMNRALKYKAES